MAERLKAPVLKAQGLSMHFRSNYILLRTLLIYLNLDFKKHAILSYETRDKLETKKIVFTSNPKPRSVKAFSCNNYSDSTQSVAVYRPDAPVSELCCLTLIKDFSGKNI